MEHTITNLQLSIIMSAYVGNDMYSRGYEDTMPIRLRPTHTSFCAHAIYPVVSHNVRP